MSEYQGNSTGNMSVKVKDYQPKTAQFAGKANEKANMYMERTDKAMNKQASKVKGQAYKGRYD